MFGAGSTDVRAVIDVTVLGHATIGRRHEMRTVSACEIARHSTRMFKQQKSQSTRTPAWPVADGTDVCFGAISPFV